MELLQLLRALRRRWKFAVVVFILGIISAAAVTFAIAPTYKSEARIYVTSATAETVDAYNAGLYSAARIASYADLAKDPAVLQRVIDRVGLPITPAELAPRVTSVAVPNTIILQVSITDSDPETARNLTRAEADEIIKLVADLETPEEPADEDEDKPVAPVVARLAGDASFNPDPVSPNLPLNLAVGALLGLLIGVAGAVVRDLLDTSIKSPDDLVEASGAPVMSVVPYDATVPKTPLISDSEGRSQRGEAFRVLRTNLQFVDLDARRQVLVVSSALPDEGKSVTATNLALAMAQTGRRVLLLDGDFRKPRVARLLGLENSVGLLTALVGRAELPDCIQHHESGVEFLGTGPIPPNPAEVLETQAMRDLIAEVREAYDLVIVDAPPVLPVADPTILAPMADGVLLVTRHGRTSREHVRQTVERLDAVGARIVGIVLNMSPMRAMSGYGYGYGYGYGEQPEAAGSQAKPPKARRSRTVGNKHTAVGRTK